LEELKMASEALEQIVEFAPRMQTGLNRTTDFYMTGIATLYTSNPFGDPEIKQIGGTNSPYGVIDKPDYLNGGIERFRTPEFDLRHGNHMNYEIVIPGIKEPIIDVHIPMDNPMDNPWGNPGNKPWSGWE
jgi:hypothetical protein